MGGQSHVPMGSAILSPHNATSSHHFGFITPSAQLGTHLHPSGSFHLRQLQPKGPFSGKAITFHPGAVGKEPGRGAVRMGRGYGHRLLPPTARSAEMAILAITQCRGYPGRWQLTTGGLWALEGTL